MDDKSLFSYLGDWWSSITSPSVVSAQTATVAPSQVPPVQNSVLKTDPAPVNTNVFGSTPSKTPGMFSGLGSAMGLTGWGDGLSNGDVYQAENGKYMKSGMFTDSEITNPNSAKSYADYKTMGGTGTTEQYSDANFKQGYLDNQSFTSNAQLGLGALQFGAGLYSTFGPNGSMDMNKKNMQVMDTQIENNRDIIDNRKKRAANITKYFGDGVRY